MPGGAMVADPDRTLATPLSVPGCGGDDADEPRPLAAATESGSAHDFDLRKVASGLNLPDVRGSRAGRRRRALGAGTAGAGGAARPAISKRTVLDLRERVQTGAEQGLLGVAFHPDFALHRTPLPPLDGAWGRQQGRRSSGGGRTGRSVAAGADAAAPGPAGGEPNGGQLAFGPDDRLYLGLGDGGGALDPRDNAQDRNTLLGKLVSTDVRDAHPRWRVILYGLRNPWRFSFDYALGEIWIGDVGQDAVEEINRVQLEPDEPPKNLGWNAYEGSDRLDEFSLAGDGELGGRRPPTPTTTVARSPAESSIPAFTCRASRPLRLRRLLL